MFQTIRWTPFSDVYFGRMSQYGHHSHYQSSSSVGSDKPWDIVAAAAAAAAANVNNIKSTSSLSSGNGNFGFPNGFQSINGGGNNGNNVSGNYLNNGGGSLPGHQQNVHTSAWGHGDSGLLYAAANQSQCSTWVDQQQQQRQAQQQQVLQQAHQQAQLLSAANASNFFAGHLSSPTSSRITTGWSTKLPQALISAAIVDETSSSSTHKFETHPQQSPTYLQRYSSTTSCADVNFSSYVSSANAASSLTKLPGHQSTNLPPYHSPLTANNVGGGQNAPLYHSSLELDMLRTIANANSSKSMKMSPNFSSPSHSYADAAANLGINAATLSAYFCPSNVSSCSTSIAGAHQNRIKREPSSSPRLNSSELEAAKTMLSIQTNLAKENSILNNDYQQISPAVSETSSTKLSSPAETNATDNNLDKNETILATNRNSQYSRDDARAQLNTDVPSTVVMNNNVSSSIPTSAKCTQEIVGGVVVKDFVGTPYDHHHQPKRAKLTEDKFVVTNENNAEDPPRDNFTTTSGISVVSRKNSAQGISSVSSSVVQTSCEHDVTLSSVSPRNDRESDDSNPTPNLMIVAPTISPISNSGSRNGNLSSSNAPISGYGLQTHATSNHGTVYNCHICKFSSTSKFHFNSHMNTHADHKCTYCDYTSRTEGRLKRHMKDFHTHINSTQDGEDSGGRCSPPSPDENTALIEQEVMAVVSSVAGHSSDYDPSSNSSAKDKQQSTSAKSKSYRCKQCTFVANSKTEFWLHQKSAHIKGDRVLSCPRCSFVTEYKHHLEYHLRNHFGSKPFKCTKCNYSCVNKSMLNSHMKSHSNFYQYRCDDCTYATKYCHSLKMHLRKYGHRPSSVINPDGSATEPGVIDVYGNRRGPRTKKQCGGGHVPTNCSNAVTSITALLPPITAPSAMNGAAPSSSNAAPLAPLMEALQNSYLKQQQDLTTAMVTSIATLGAQLPTVPSFIQRNDANNLIEESLPIHPTTGQYLKCSLCDYETADGKEVLTIHIMSHIMKNKNLCGLYNFSEGRVASVSASSSSSTPNDQFGGSNPADANTRLSSTPKDDQRSRSNSFAARFGTETASPVRISPSQDLSQDSTSPASASCEKNSGDESFGGVEVTSSHKRRRKGKAYKLDKIALRLQGRTQTPNSSKEDEAEITDTCCSSSVNAAQTSTIPCSPENVTQGSSNGMKTKQ